MITTWWSFCSKDIQNTHAFTLLRTEHCTFEGWVVCVGGGGGGGDAVNYQKFSYKTEYINVH